MTLLLIQYICARFNLACAYNFPTVIAAGNAGGTTIVMMSSALIAISLAVIPLEA